MTRQLFVNYKCGNEERNEVDQEEERRKKICTNDLELQTFFTNTFEYFMILLKGEVVGENHNNFYKNE